MTLVLHPAWNHTDGHSAASNEEAGLRDAGRTRHGTDNDKSQVAVERSNLARMVSYPRRVQKFRHHSDVRKDAGLTVHVWPTVPSVDDLRLLDAVQYAEKRALTENFARNKSAKMRAGDAGTVACILVGRAPQCPGK